MCRPTTQPRVTPNPAAPPVARAGPSAGHRAVRGFILLLATNVLARASGFLSQLVLAVLLAPADFGVIGLTYTVGSLAATFTNIGIDDVLLQRLRALRFWSGAAFWISLGLASLVAVAVLLSAPVAATLFHAPELVGLLAVLALAMPINALSSVPTMVLRSRMQFATFAGYGMFEVITQALMTIALAWAKFGAYSFVIPMPIMGLLRAVVYWRIAAIRVRLRPQRRRWKYLVRNTAASFLGRVIGTCINQGDYFVLGLLATQDVVGVYYFGFRLAAQPVWMLAGNFGSVLYPALIEMKSDTARQGAAVLRASILLSYCVMPLAFLQAAVAAPAIDRFFGQKWHGSIPIIQLLSLGLALDAVSWVAGTLMAARGEFARGLRYLSMQAPVFFALVIAGAYADQAIGVAIAVCLFYAITQPIFVYGVYRRFGLGVRQVALLYIKPAALAGSAVGAGLAASWLLASHDPIACIALIGAVSIPVYAALLRWWAPQVWHDLASQARKALSRH